MHRDIISLVINHKSVSLMVTEIWLIEIFEGQFDLDLISQGHHKYGEYLEGQFDLDLLSQCHHEYGK